MLSAYDIGQKQQCLPDYYRNRLTPKILISSLLVLLLIIPSILPPSAVATTSLSSENIELELKATIKDFREKKRTIEKERLHYQQQLDKLREHIRKLNDKLSQSDSIVPETQQLSALQRQQQILKNSHQLFSYAQRLQVLMNRLIKNSEYLKNIPQKLMDTKDSIKSDERMLKKMQLSPIDCHQLEIDLQKEKIDYHYLQKKKLSIQKLYYQVDVAAIEQEAKLINKQHQQLEQKQQEDIKVLSALDLEPTQYQLLNYLENNRLLSTSLIQQQRQLQKILSEQQAIDNKFLNIQQELEQLRNLASWKIRKPKTSQNLRSQKLKLTISFDLRQIFREVSKFDDKQSEYESDLKKLEQENQAFAHSYSTYPPGRQLPPLENEKIKSQKLLKRLIKSIETITEQFDILYKKKIELTQDQKRLQIETDRRLFWITDANPVGLNFPMLVAKDIQTILHSGLVTDLHSVAVSGSHILLFSLVLAAFLLEWSARRKQLLFLQHAATRVGNVTQDSFNLTTATVGWALGAALPLPLLIGVIGQVLLDSTLEPLDSTFRNIAPFLWGLRVCANFAHPQGLFIKHFGWDARKVSRISHYYLLAAWVILPLMVLLTLLNQFEGHQYAETLGRTTFFLLCTVLWALIIGIKHTGVTFYLTRKALAQNFLNRLLWMLLLGIPLLANLFSLFGYTTASQELLFRLAGSVGIWFTLLIIYHLAWRWMLIQRRRLAFERAKQRRASKLAQRTRIDDELVRMDPSLEIQLLDLETMSSRSLQLLRSIIAMATLMALIAWWSKMHPAFGFLENYPLWNMDTLSQGTQISKSVTLRDLLKAVLFFIITMQLVRNLPAVLELALLQHLDLTHGTSYAITAVTKYLLSLIGGFIVIYLLGIDWPKIQWVATALGVGFGFGLKDIFANFISGLILLFEKPIRIGDTVTVKDFHGTVTRISTRATVITDWDRKEIIVPNHNLVIEQFINWTLSDTVVRLVLQLTTLATVDPKLIKKLFKQAAKKCTLLLVNPAPEIYLNELQQGLQAFEIRLYAAEPSHRMPLRHEFHERILFLCRKHHITLPYPPTQLRIEAVSQATQEKFSNIRSQGA
ncbi:MAG: miniconductance mechanosensitive channel MscM [Candidatus Symbiodolus clandestinus]